MSKKKKNCTGFSQVVKEIKDEIAELLNPLTFNLKLLQYLRTT